MIGTIVLIVVVLILLPLIGQERVRGVPVETA
jgi:hypothetical protein